MSKENKLIMGLTYINKMLKDDPEMSLHNAAFTASRYISGIGSREFFNKYEEMSENGKLELFSLKEVDGNWILLSKLNPGNIIKVFNNKPDNSDVQYAITKAMRIYMRENADSLSKLILEQKEKISYKLLSTVVFPNVSLNESITNNFIFEEIELYEGFLDTVKAYLKNKADDTMNDVSSTITNFKDAGIIIKDVITDADMLEKVSMQIGKRLRTQIKNIKTIITNAATSTNNKRIDDAANKINNILELFNTGLRKSIQLGGWKGLLYKLGMYGFVKFIYTKISGIRKLSDLVVFVSGEVISEFADKFDIFQNMMNTIASLTMQKFMNFFAGLNEVKEIFVDTLAEIKRKLSVGNNLSSSINEHGGRVVKGVNTTADVGPDEIKKQAAKFGNKVNKDGYPPELNKRARKNTTTNKLFNMGLSEKIDYIKKLEQAILEGGHTLEEGPRDALRRLGKAAAVASSMSSMGAMGAVGYDTMSPTKANAAQAPSSYIEEPSSNVRPNARTNVATDQATKSSLRPKAKPDDSPEDQIRPKAKPDTIVLTDSPLEKELAKYARNQGIIGVELASLMSQAFVETMGFTRMVERGSQKYFNKYEPKYSPKRAKKLGNKKDGDGIKYKGRGFVQLTGRYNYARAGKELGIDLINNPDLAADPKIALQIALWYWGWKVDRLTDNFSNVKGVTKLINGGYHGLEERTTAYSRYKQRMIMTGELTERKNPNQVKGKEKMPKKSKPSRTGEQKHPYRGRLVGENTFFKDGKISKDFVNYIKENLSITGTETAREARKKGLEPGTPEWFEHWFSLPYMIDRRKKNKGRTGKR